MYMYLPIALTSVNYLVVMGLGLGVGLLSGLFGVGGGFLIAERADAHLSCRSRGDTRSSSVPHCK